MELITVDVKVGKIIKEFIRCTNGSDNIVPQKDDILWCLVKQHLELSPTTPFIVKDTEEYVKISLRNSNSKVYNIQKEDVVRVKTLFRNFISEKGQAVLRKHFEKEFKNVFRLFMRAQMIANPDIKIKDAIDNFCTEWNLSLDAISVSMLKKDWYRYRLNFKIKNICPLIF